MLPKKILWAVLLIIVTGACSEHNKTEKKPNIILIMADDLGYGGIGCYGNRNINTPNLDTLAANGIRFTDFHSNGAVCTPTRAALLTGRYQQRSGMEGVIYVRGEARKMGMDSTVITIADVLTKAGYEAAIIGKWHLGYEAQFNPVYNGFNEFRGYRSGNIDYHTHYDNAGIYDWFHNLDSTEEGGYVTDLITKHSIDFIKKNKANPFFLYIAHEAPHVPFQGRNDPGYRLPGKEFSYFGPVEDRKRAYKEMVEVMDESIGTVMNTLKETGLVKKTLVIFISDNGGLKGYGNNDPLRGAKTTLFEGGHRVPAIASWQGKIDQGISDDLVMSFDFFPTILSLCDIETPDDLLLDGIDISPMLFKQINLEKRDVFWRYRNQWSIRSGPLKLLLVDGDTLLFNLSSDLEEKNNLAADSPDLLSSMLKALSDWDKDMNEYKQKTQ